MKRNSLLNWRSVLVGVASLLLIGGSPKVACAQQQSKAPEQVNRAEFVFIGGQVKVPQRYVYTNGLTLVGGIRMAGGLTSQAEPRKVMLTRTGQKPLQVDIQPIEQARAKDIQLQPGDRVHVPKK